MTPNTNNKVNLAPSLQLKPIEPGYGEIDAGNGFTLQIKHPMGLPAKWLPLRDSIIAAVNEREELIAALRAAMEEAPHSSYCPIVNYQVPCKCDWRVLASAVLECAEKHQ